MGFRNVNLFHFRACLHGGGGPQVSEVTHFNPPVHIISYYNGHANYHVNVIKLK